MKKLLLIPVLLLSCCCGDTLTEEQLENSSLIKKFEIVFHHTENCNGHSLWFGKADFQLDGHDMWYICPENGQSGESKILHSPDCEKCKSGIKEEIPSILDEPKTDYWGW